MKKDQRLDQHLIFMVYWSWSIPDRKHLIAVTSCFTRLQTGRKTLEPEVQSDIWPTLMHRSKTFLLCLRILFIEGVIKWIIRMHSTSRPAERRLRLVTFVKGKQHEMRGNTENYNRILALFPLYIAVSCAPIKANTHSYTPTRRIVRN